MPIKKKKEAKKKKRLFCDAVSVALLASRIYRDSAQQALIILYS
jgi:hypothetical protein